MIQLISKKALSAQIRTEIDNAIPAELRSHRKLDLDKPIRLDPRPLIEIRDCVIKTALKKMFGDTTFYVTDFDRIVQLADVYPPPGLRKTLEPLHCVKWCQMDADLRDQVQQHILALVIPIEKQEDES